MELLGFHYFDNNVELEDFIRDYKHKPITVLYIDWTENRIDFDDSRPEPQG